MGVTGARMTERQREWHLDRKVTLALILGLLGQTLGAGWWAAQMDAAIGANREDIARLEQRQDLVRLALPRIEERLGIIIDRLDRAGSRPD